MKGEVEKHFMNTKSLIIASFMGVIAAILQSAGNWLPGVGYLISALSTLPMILVCLTTSFRYASMSFVLACFLLVYIQPTEAFVFPFTTGLLGLCLGEGFRYLQNRISIILSGAIPLWLGILFILYGVQFPVLGPAVSSAFNLVPVLGILIFTILYSVIWEAAVRIIIKKYFQHFIHKS